MYMRGSPERLALKAVRLPSGAHDGYSPPSGWGRRRCPDPSAFMTAIQLLPEAPRAGAYAIIEPSGDQVGKPLSRVSRCCPDPSALMTQTSGCPWGSDRYAMKRPPSDNDGSNSGQGECVSRLRPVPSALIIHTSSWLSKAILPDSEDSEM